MEIKVSFKSKIDNNNIPKFQKSLYTNGYKFLYESFIEIYNIRDLNMTKIADNIIQIFFTASIEEELFERFKMLFDEFGEIAWCNSFFELGSVDDLQFNIIGG